MQICKPYVKWMFCAACLWMVAESLSASSIMAGEILSQVRSNDILRCGVTERLLGFSFKDQNGRWQGINVDLCRAVAVAALGSAEKVLFMPLSSPNRFPVLLSGRIDLLAHTVTWTFGREAGIGIRFPVVYFYDSQAFMVPSDKKDIHRLEDLDGATICVEKKTTFQINMANTFRARGIRYTPLEVDSLDEMRKAFREGDCLACTAERSVLSAKRAEGSGGSERYKILSEEISEEPLALAVQSGDEEWATLVRWVVFVLIEAERRGVTSTNVRTLQEKNTDPELRWFLESSGKRGRRLGLKPGWVTDIVSAVGNYGEIYERNLGRASGLNIERGRNRLTKQGGLLDAPPFQ